MAAGRKLKLKARAERMEQTRQRIVQAAYELHASLGPARTTTSAIAKRAGVQRLTVYHHFPDEIVLARACTSYGLQADPLPEPARWAEIAAPEARLRSALSEVYGYYRRNEGIWSNVLRDVPLLPPDVRGQVGDLIQPFFDIQTQGRQMLAAAWPDHRHSYERLLAVLGLALDFQVWRSLTQQQGLDDQRAIDLMVDLASCCGQG